MSTENNWRTVNPSIMARAINKKKSTRADWLIPAALILLSIIPFLGGLVRLFSLAGGTAVTPENERFFAAPLPVIIHIIGATAFCILGAFQFSSGFRRRHPAWHRRVGRVLIACGLAAGLSGVWMTLFYTFDSEVQGSLLYGFRIVFGSGMVLSLVLSLAAILRRDFTQHRAWIIRGYAIGQGAGTQALAGILWLIIAGSMPTGFENALMMGGCWFINLAVAEWIIRRRPIII